MNRRLLLTPKEASAVEDALVAVLSAPSPLRRQIGLEQTDQLLRSVLGRLEDATDGPGPGRPRLDAGR
jgi:hypothetical protein